ATEQAPRNRRPTVVVTRNGARSRGKSRTIRASNPFPTVSLCPRAARAARHIARPALAYARIRRYLLLLTLIREHPERAMIRKPALALATMLLAAPLAADTGPTDPVVHRF